MSGIVGIYYLDGRGVDPVDLGKMVDVLAHRGPDGAEVWHQGCMGLGHRMLWSTPESLDEQLPMVAQQGALVLTADARIDNRDELISALGLKSRPVPEISDSELILAAYEKWGEDCPQYLLGAFAFAIWDACRRQMFFARDHLGVKPFYYFHQPGQMFVFASEIKALFTLVEVPRRLNETMIGDYLVPLFEDKEITFYQDIFRLPAAHTMTISPDAVWSNQYWELDPQQELRFESDEAYTDAFRELFFEAIRCRLRTAFPIGSSLSGGLDSSSVVCVARDLLAEMGQDQLHTFSYIYDDVPQCDERDFIEAVLQQGGLVSHFLHGDQHSPLVDSDQVMWHFDEAVVGPNLYLPWGLSRAAQQKNIRVLLDGFDGDTVISHGDFYLTELVYNRQWRELAKNSTELAQNFDYPTTKILQDYGLGPLLKQAQRWQWLTYANDVNEISRYFNVSRRRLWKLGLKSATAPLQQLWSQNGADKNKNGVPIKPEFAQQIGLETRRRALDLSETNPPQTQKEEHWLSLTTGGLAYVLELSDKAAAAFSIESRHPFMDKRLVEFCLALPAEQKLSQGWTRNILRRSLVRILPEQVRLRNNKANLEDNFVYTLLKYERERVDNLILTDSDIIEKYLDLNMVRAAYQRLTSSKKYDSKDIMTVWKAVNLAMWLHYVDLSPT